MVKVGEIAPSFSSKALVNEAEVEISLEDYRGSKVALYFYPKDLTPGCTTQAENLRDNFEELKENNIVILGVSIDPIKSHLKFVEKKELPFILVSDEEKKIVNDYGVWVEKSMYGRKYMGTARKTFLIDEKGVLVSIIEKPKVSDHAKEILKAFE